MTPSVHNITLSRILSKFWQCRLCGGCLRAARSLPCSHSFCTDCLEADIRSRNAISLGSYCCVTCGTTSLLPSAGTRGFPENVFVGELQGLTEVGSQPPASLQDCQCKLCTDLRSQLTRVDDARKYLDKSRDKFNSSLVCVSHGNSEKYLFCCACEVSCCEGCIEEFHRGHTKEVRPIETVSADATRLIESTVDVLRLKCSQFGRRVETAKAVEEAVFCSRRGAADAIDARAAALHAAVDEIAQTRKNQLEEVCDTELSLIRGKIKDLNEAATALKDVTAFAETHSPHGGLEAIENSIGLVSRLGQLLPSPGPATTLTLSLKPADSEATTSQVARLFGQLNCRRGIRTDSRSAQPLSGLARASITQHWPPICGDQPSYKQLLTTLDDDDNLVAFDQNNGKVLKFVGGTTTISDQFVIDSAEIIPLVAGVSGCYLYFNNKLDSSLLYRFDLISKKLDTFDSPVAEIGSICRLNNSEIAIHCKISGDVVVCDLNCVYFKHLANIQDVVLFCAKENKLYSIKGNKLSIFNTADGKAESLELQLPMLEHAAIIANISVTKDDYIIAVDYPNESILRFAEDGSKGKVICGRKDGLNLPQCVHASKVAAGTCVVTQEDGIAILLDYANCV